MIRKVETELKTRYEGEVQIKCNPYGRPKFLRMTLNRFEYEVRAVRDHSQEIPTADAYLYRVDSYDTRSKVGTGSILFSDAEEILDYINRIVERDKKSIRR